MASQADVKESQLDASDRRAEITAYLKDLTRSRVFAASRRRSDLLSYLVERTLAGKADAISEYGIGLDVYQKPESFDPRTDSTVRSDMSRLRRMLTEHYRAAGAADPWRIDFPTRGYVPDIQPAITRGRPAPAPTAVAPHSFLPRYIAACAVAVLAIGGIVLWKANPPSPNRHSVVVLPFENLTGDAHNAYLTDGITEQLTDSLAQVSTLRVVARTSAFQYRNKAVDVRSIGRQLDVEVVIEGSLRKTDKGYTLTVQANRTADGFHILSRAFDGPPSDLARLEYEMVEPVVTALRARTPYDRVPGPAAPSQDAYELYLKGLSLLNARGWRDLERATAYFDQAIAKDPAFARAWTSEAETNILQALYRGPSEPYMSRARTEVARALQLNSNSAEAHYCSGAISALYDYDFRTAEREFQTALRLSPNSVQAHSWHATMVLTPQRRFDAALAELRQSRALDPLSSGPIVEEGWVYFFERQYSRARKSIEQAITMDPASIQAHSHLSNVYWQQGNYDGWLKEHERITELMNGSPDTSVRSMYQKQGIAALVAKDLETARDSARGSVPSAGRAAMALKTGSPDLAMADLLASYELRDSALVYANVSPSFDQLRGDPRFRALMHRIGL